MSDVLRGEVGAVCLDHPLAVVPFLATDLGFVDLEAGAAAREKAAVSAIADECLVPLLQLLTERRHNRIPVGLVLPGLFDVQADDVAAVLDDNLFHLERGWIVRFLPWAADNAVAARPRQHFLIDLLRTPQSGPEDVVRPVVSGLQRVH